ncbi:MAG: amino acid adenylation domain-containing protein, partial [Candidatus Aminicenantes bacterium]
RPAYKAPRNETEKKLVETWSRILDIEKEAIGIDHNFFELGGHSLKATLMTSQIHKELNVKLPLAEIFKTPTIRDLAEYIKKSSRDIHEDIQPVEKRDYYLQSSAQERLYILQQMEPGSTAYNMPQVIPLSMQPDMKKLAETFMKLIKRHESLRTSFLIINEEPVQRIHDQVDFELEYKKVEVKVEAEWSSSLEGTRGLAPLPEEPAARSSQPASALISSFIRPFDLTRAPLMRVGLTKSVGHPYILVVDMHHIISDGISRQILAKDFMAIYDRKALPRLRLQYKDFALWQNKEKEKENLHPQEIYWLREFEQEIPVVNLPVDFPRPDVKNFEGSTEKFEISTDDTCILKSMAIEETVTLYMVLLAVFNILLSKLSGQEDVVIGTPVTGRRHRDLEKIIGMFVNTLALRNSPNGEKTFRDFLIEIKERTLQAFENQDYQFEDLVEKVAVNRDASRNPLFDIMYILQNFDGNPGQRKTYVKQEQYGAQPGISKFDMAFNGVELGEKLVFIVEYCTKLFKKETIKRFIKYFQNIVSSILEKPGRRLSEIDIITGEEKQQILNDFNDTAADYPKNKTIHQLFEEQAAKTPDNIALHGRLNTWLHGEDASITYKEADEQSRQLVYVLRSKGVKPDTIAAVMAERSPEMIIGILGILKAGGAYLPIDPDYPQERIIYMLKDSSAKVLLVGDTSCASWLSFAPKSLLNLSEGHHLNFPASQLPSFPASLPSSLAYVIYTSGSTGRPKGVLVRHHGVVNMVRFHHKIFCDNPRARISQVANASFDAMVFEMWPSLLAGAVLCIADNETRLDPRSMKEWLIVYQITISFQPTRMAQLLLEEHWPETGTALKILRAAGDRLTFYPTRSYPFRFYNLYGPTEDTVWTTWAEVPVNPSQTRMTKLPPIGKPVTNKKVYILSHDLKLQVIGVGGELSISGVGLARGYLNNPGLTAEKFRKTVILPHSPIYLTGDLARWLPDGNIEFLGRIDGQVKIRGFRIELGEIETQLLKNQDIQEAVVLAKEQKDGEKYLCAYIVSGEELGVSDLKGYLSSMLPAYMIPPYMKQIEKIPLTPNGKIDTKALPFPEIKPKGKYTAPRNAIEETLAQLWSEVLVTDEVIGIDDNFFELGGHSLNAALLTSKIHQSLNVKLPLAEVFRTPVIRELATYIKGISPHRYTSIPPLEKKEYYELSSAQKRLYVLHQMALESTAYNIYQVIPLAAELDIKKLEETFMKLIKRHESLRTSFLMINEEPVQKVHEFENVEFKIEYKEVEVEEERSPVLEGTRGLVPLSGPATRNSQPATGTIKNFIHPFDLSRAPLLRVGLIKSIDHQHMLMLDMHHIISDGVSHQVLAKNFMALYQGKWLPRLPIQYKDFTGWQNKEKENLVQQERYWLKEYEQEIPVLNLPTDFPRPALQSFAGDTSGFHIGKEETDRLKSLILAEKVTMFMGLLAIFNVLLAKLSGQEDIVVGTGIEGRRHE